MYKKCHARRAEACLVVRRRDRSPSESCDHGEVIFRCRDPDEVVSLWSLEVNADQCVGCILAAAVVSVVARSEEASHLFAVPENALLGDNVFV
jgi:hypothetical protein